MRIFIAINFTEEIKHNLYEQILNLKGKSIKGNFTRKENLHLTLAFLGEVDEKHLETLKNVINQLEVSEFPINLSNMSAFHNGDELLPWIGIVPNTKLQVLQQQLTEGLKASGFAHDEKKFTPHVTLGRKVLMKSNTELNRYDGLCGKEIVVNAISIMKSERINGILTYTEIYKRKI
ncbi:RNA 2',3'-cyclic phosphodiesterase [Lachnoclostridium phytofermentans]|uniref:RNA 2',3'-cyclic phosphodiesterase n=1 Tax=Lachnoclostridium phytofermentans (strain ATCC 700394 / DSM 18823 / ISDg) TaxID=357809 RepID=A9KM39_LACP7|nr:RNA 2',3'-cyclic phosphodiesterase [Lachnoclostridium phytofermentans]ABX41382.1 2'-5' RNA ligase [Lachnoclostridium phytofermentans ISDg]